MRSNRTVIAVALAAAMLVAGLAADDKPPPDAATPASPDEVKIRETSQALARAFEKGDAKAVTAFWTELGEYIDEDGTPIHGRAALMKTYGEFFAKRKAVTVSTRTDKVRFLGKDTALEEGTFTVKPTDGPAVSNRYSALFVRENGRWLIALLKEWEDHTVNRTSLKDLGWLIGTWEGEGGDAKVRTHYDWTTNKSFIHGEYTVTAKKDGSILGGGTQVIGFDPAADTVRAWTFDRDGGFGEATWTWDGERWTIDSTGTLADGSQTTALNFLTRNGDDAFTWRSVQRTVGGDKLPDLAPVKATRVKGAKAAASTSKAEGKP